MINRKKIFLSTFFALLFFVLQASTTLAVDKLPIGSPCSGPVSGNSECRSNDCEGSQKKDASGKTLSFCDCVTANDCNIEYGTPATGKWECSDGAAYTYNSDYCYNPTTKEAKVFSGINKNATPISKLTDAIFDSPATQAALLEKVKTFTPNLEITVPGIEFSNLASTTDEEGYLNIPWIGEYIVGVYTYVLGIAAIIAAIMIIIAGVQWTTSGGNSETIGSAKKRIGGALVGLLIAYLSYAVLNIINPGLTTFKSLKVKYIVRDELEMMNEIASDGIAYSGPSTFGSNGVPDIKQCDAKWKDLAYDGPRNSLGCFDGVTRDSSNKSNLKGSICAGGCGITSLADVLNYYGVSVSPVNTAAYSVKVGARNQKCYGTIGDILCSNIAKEYPGFSCRKLDKSKLNEMTELLRQKKPLIFSCHGCSGIQKDGALTSYNAHYMVLTGVDETGNWFSVNDPGRSTNRAMAKIASSEFPTNKIQYVFLVTKNDGSVPNVGNSNSAPTNNNNGICTTLTNTFSSTKDDCTNQSGDWQPQ